MATIIGTLGRDTLRGVDDGQDDLIFGDTNATLSSGRGGDDLILAAASDFTGAYGDALEIKGTGHGGNDRLFGNTSADSLIGDADEMRGHAIGGDDFLSGGSGDGDGLVGDAAVLIVGHARGGNDTLLGGADRDFLWGDTTFMAKNARGGDDRLDGGGGNDTLIGDNDIMRGHTVGGDDRLAGGEGPDAILGDAGEMLENARGGDDKLEGGDDGDRLFGDAGVINSGTVSCGNDRLFGGIGADFLVGDAEQTFNAAKAVCGNDWLGGGFGDDELWGDVQAIQSGSITAGSDIFAFRRGSGNDTVGDFNDGATGAQDRLHLAGYRGVTSFADLSGFITQDGDDTVIDLGGATGQGAGLDTIRLLNTTATSFGASDFVF